MKKPKLEYIIFSPDGFAIDREQTHHTPKKAWAAFEQWKKRFERQGYYATVSAGQRLRIPLAELKQHCSLNSIQIIEAK